MSCKVEIKIGKIVRSVTSEMGNEVTDQICQCDAEDDYQSVVKLLAR